MFNDNLNVLVIPEENQIKFALYGIAMSNQLSTPGRKINPFVLLEAQGE